MNTFIALLLSLSLVSSPRPQHQGNAINGRASVSQQEFRIQSDSSFSVDNETTVNIGILTISLADQSSTNLSVPSTGTFYSNISSSPVLCVINGQSFGYSDQKRIIIDSHTSVRVTWSSPAVVIVD